MKIIIGIIITLFSLPAYAALPDMITDPATRDVIEYLDAKLEDVRDGVTGPRGYPGPKGDTGATGPAGPQGPAGADGVVDYNLVVLKAGSTMTGQLTVQSSITATGNISAARYAVNGSTILALSGTGGLVVGRLAGDFNTGIGNVFVGDQTGYSNTAGAYNTFVGGAAGYPNTTGSYNTYIGGVAGRYGTGNNNTALGYYSGYNSTGSNNIFLGYKAGESTTSGSGNIILGYDIDAPAATTSSYLNIGGLVHGTIGGSSVTVRGDLFVDDTVTASSFHGDGSNLSGGYPVHGDGQLRPPCRHGDLPCDGSGGLCGGAVYLGPHG